MARVALGLDFGTSTTLLSRSSGVSASTLRLGTVDSWIPSVIGVDGAQFLVGDDALRLPERQLIRSIKRTITEGRTHVEVFDGTAMRGVPVDRAIQFFLRNVLRTAENAGIDMEHAEVLLGCPAMWDGPRRQRLLGIARAAGFVVGDATLIDEPIAAAVTWINERWNLQQGVAGKVLVVDMGGGSLDVAVLEVEAYDGGPRPAISVQAARGVGRAGDELDDRVARAFAERLAEEGAYRDVPDGDHADWPWLLRAAREAKVALSTQEAASVVVDASDGPHRVRLTRDQLTALFEPLLDSTIRVCVDALREALVTEAAQISPAEARKRSEEELFEGVDYVVLAGGMSQGHLLVEGLGQKLDPVRIYNAQPPESPVEMIADGLAQVETIERLNLHRPGFDFVLEWNGGAEKVYTAYSPLYSTFQVFHTDQTSHRWTPSSEVPRRGDGRLVLRSVSGQPIEFRHEGRSIPDLAYHFGNSSDQVILLDSRGDILVRDGRGNVSRLRVKQWPVIGSLGANALEIAARDPSDDPIAKLPWHLRPYD